ncbi:MAG: hypothetical protein ABR609_07845 [Acidimicrobiia bacterium]
MEGASTGQILTKQADGSWGPSAPASPTSVRNLDDGTAAAPSVAFASDPDTGVYRGTDNSVALASGGVTKVRTDQGTTALFFFGHANPDSNNGRDLGVAGLNWRSLAIGTSVVVAGTKVIGTQGAAVADADGTLADLTTKFNTLLARLRAHGLIAT